MIKSLISNIIDWNYQHIYFIQLSANLTESNRFTYIYTDDLCRIGDTEIMIDRVSINVTYKPCIYFLQCMACALRFWISFLKFTVYRKFIRKTMKFKYDITLHWEIKYTLCFSSFTTNGKIMLRSLIWKKKSLIRKILFDELHNSSSYLFAICRALSSISIDLIHGINAGPACGITLLLCPGV